MAVYALLNTLLILMAVFLHGNIPVYALLGVDFFMSIMFPTIFSMSIHGLGKKTKEGSSLVIMAIVGGAACTYGFAAVADAINIQIAYLVPAFCFLYIFIYAFRRLKTTKLKIAAAH